MKDFQYEIVTIPAYRGVGLKWDGSYVEVSSLGKLVENMRIRVGELEHVVNPDIQLGLSYHLRPDGFVHYSVFEVSYDQPIPADMVEIHVPEMTCMLTHHEKGQDIGETYKKVAQWVKEESDFTPFMESDVTYYDALPIKHEHYPVDRDMNDPHFDILIPVVKK
ncbi:hypothetical protein GCM10009001_09120 [Virgibacillus siamensis]|uniref:AraC effector-binding domain-containing protein n=1 Tax=Virgibacillus siamensis TaxID=480071 RepID=A0ABN1FPM1_9BACI